MTFNLIYRNQDYLYVNFMFNKKNLILLNDRILCLISCICKYYLMLETVVFSPHKKSLKCFIEIKGKLLHAIQMHTIQISFNIHYKMKHLKNKYFRHYDEMVKIEQIS